MSQQMTPGQQQAQGPAPFRQNEKPRLRFVDSRDFKNNAVVSPSLPMPQIGWLARIWVFFTGTVTCAGAGTLAQDGAHSLVRRFELQSNEGGIAHIDLSGYEAHVMATFVTERGFRPDRAGSGSTTPHADIHSVPVANGANTWNLCWILPVNLNMGENRAVGLVDLQQREITQKLRITCEDGANVVTGLDGTIEGTFEVYYEFFNVYPDTVVQAPPLVVVRTISDISPITQQGDFNYEVSKEGSLVQMVHFVRLNNLRTEGFDKVMQVFSNNDTPLEASRKLMRLRTRIHYDIDLDTGLIVHDYFAATQHVNDGDFVDFINTRNVALFQSRIHITGALGAAGTNNVSTIRRFIQAARVGGA